MMILLRIGIALIGLALLSGGEAMAGTLAAWSQFVGNGRVEARLVTDEAACPNLVADGIAQPMTVRLAPSAAFPAHVCVATLPAGARSVYAGNAILPVPKARPRHIVVVGDTGCRLKGEVVQDCNNEAHWPFHQVAISAARERPDLVIHVGDYLYRETPCQDGDRRCAGTPTGDNWPTWAADFFSPGRDLLAAAPWVLTRGNHEDCKRGGIGWTALLGRDPVSQSCNPRDQPMLVDIGGILLGVLDENDADDKGEGKPGVKEALHNDLMTLAAGHPDWLITHHPFRGVAKLVKENKLTTVEGANRTLLAALQGYDEASLTLMLSGHIHNFQIENYSAPHPPQLVVGEGGDNLDKKVPLRLTGLVSGEEKITSGLSIPGFGYVVMDRVKDSKDWKIFVHAADGALLRRCALKARQLSCSEKKA